MTSGTSLGDEGDTVVTVVGPTIPPDAIRSLDTLESPDYADFFTATTSGATDRSAEEWARAVLEGTPTGRSAPFLWSRLGLRLGPTPSPDHVQGWKIADRGDDWLRIEATSWFMTAHAVVHVDDRLVSLALFVRYDQPIAAVIWPPVSLMHRRAVPVMLQQALPAQGVPEQEIRQARTPRSRSDACGWQGHR